MYVRYMRHVSMLVARNFPRRVAVGVWGAQRNHSQDQLHNGNYWLSMYRLPASLEALVAISLVRGLIRQAHGGKDLSFGVAHQRVT